MINLREEVCLGLKDICIELRPKTCHKRYVTFLFVYFYRNLLIRKTTLFQNMLVLFLVWTLIQNLEELIRKLQDAVLIKNKVFRIHLTDSKVQVNFMMISNSMMLLDLLFSEVMGRKLYFLLILPIKKNGVQVFVKLIWNLIQGQKLLQILRRL